MLSSSLKSVPVAWWLALALWFGMAPFTEGVAHRELVGSHGFETSFSRVERGDRAIQSLYEADARGPAPASSSTFMEESEEIDGDRLLDDRISQAIAINYPVFSEPEFYVEIAAPKKLLGLLRNNLLGLPPPT